MELKSPRTVERVARKWPRLIVTPFAPVSLREVVSDLAFCQARGSPFLRSRVYVREGSIVCPRNGMSTVSAADWVITHKSALLW